MNGILRKNVRKSLVLFLALSLLMSAFTACGKSGKKGDAKPQETATTAPKQELKPVELHWYYSGVGPQEDVKLVEDELGKYLKDKINATVKLHCFDAASYPEKLKNMIAAGEEFDICFTASWGLNYREQASKGAFIALDDMFDKYAPKTKALVGDTFLTGSKVNGKNYAVPTNKEKAQQYGLLYLKKYVDKYNLDVSKVKTLEDFEPILRTIKEKEPTLFALGGGCDALMKGTFDDLGAAGPGVIYHNGKDMKVFMREEAPEAQAYYNLIRKYYTEGYVRKDAVTTTSGGADEKAGKIFSKCSSLKPGKDKEFSMATGQEWVQINITPAYITNGDTMGSMNAISRTSKNPERALMFLELVNNDKVVNNMVCYGLEGKHYQKVSDNVIKKGPENVKFNPGQNFIFGNVFLNYLWDNEDANKWKEFEEYNKNAIPAKSLGFAFDPTPVKNELAACAAAGQDFINGLNAGVLDPKEYLPKYIKSQKDAGADKVIAEKQKQLDAWLATKK